MKPEDPWFIARDGQQHGPLSEKEMRLFVERGHLRATDLIWRQGFPDWRPAFSVFPPGGTAGAPQPSRPDTGTKPQGSAPARQAGTNHNFQGAARTAPSAQHGQSGGGFTGSPPANVTPDNVGLGDPTETSPFTTDDQFEASQPRRGGRIFAALATLALVGGGAWVYVNGAPTFFGLAATSPDTVPVVKAPETAKVAQPEKPKPAPKPPEKAALDTRLQQSELWQFLKSQYPNWYDSVLQNTEQINNGERDDRKVSQVLVARLIELRRRNAEKVLAAGPQHLTELATTFLANLKHLAGSGPVPCYNFISKGEASPAVVDAMLGPDMKTPIHNQLLATFKASVEGAKTPVNREAPQKSDYQALTGQLAKIGWNKEDIQLFANPEALSKAPPARVCQMVQDWFTAHLSLENAASQERLLHETLRPVVSG